MDRLEGKYALVGGGTGAVDEGIVRGLLQNGATVFVPSREQERLDQLRDRLDAVGTDRLVTYVGHIGTPDGAVQIRDEIQQRFGQLDIAVASLGGWWQGARLVDVPIETWDELIENNLTSHFLQAKTFMPVLAEQSNSHYVFIAGYTAVEPSPKAGPVPIAGAAELMMTRMFAKEHQGDSVQPTALVLGPVKTRDRDRVKPEWVSANDVGTFISRLAVQNRQIDDEVIYLKDQTELREQTEVISQ